MGRGMDIAVVRQNLDLQFGRRRRIYEVVTNTSCVRAVLHPRAFFKYRVSAGKSPNGYGAREMKLLDKLESLGLDRAARPAISAEGVIAARIAQDLFGF